MEGIFAKKKNGVKRTSLGVGFFENVWISV